MDTSHVLYETRERVAYITLNRPDAMNALSQEMFRALGAAFERIRDDDDILAGVITGAGGRAFSAGADLKEMSAGDAAGRTRRLGFNNFTTLGNWKPMIAAIDGYCVAAGLETAMQCDIRVATAKSTFGLPEPRWSLLAGYGLHFLSRMVPMGEALYMQLTGDRIDAERALRIGLIQEVVPDREALDAAVGRLTDSIKMCAPLALQAIKQVVYRGRYVPPEYAEQMSAPLALLVNASEDAKEGPRAFAEKQKPAWKGR
jgi:enoyl-CoA hydratase/carnithine racemase